MPNVTKTYRIGLYLDRAMKDKNISMDELSELTGINKNLLRCLVLRQEKGLIK